jgi:acid phosphatase
MENTEEVYLRSSNRTRTIESLQQVIHGLFPLDKQGNFFVPHICVRLASVILPYRPVGMTRATRNKRDENCIPQHFRLPTTQHSYGRVCKRCGVRIVNKSPISDTVRPSAAAVSMNPTLEPLDQKISKYIGGKPIRIDGSPKASGILETVSPLMLQI